MVLDASEFHRRLAGAGDGSGDGPIQRSLPCSPWDRWALVALHRHEARQRWAEQIVREQLAASPEALARFGSGGHPEGPGHGDVPGMPGWRFRFHGCGCHLRHEDGTDLDVDFDREHGSASIDPWFYERFLQTSPTLGGPELRLRGADGGWSGWRASIHPLSAAGVLDHEHRIHVRPQVSDWCEAVSQAVDRAERSERPEAGLRAIAWAVEDFPLVATLEPSAASPAVEAAAAQQIADRCEALETRIAARAGPHVDACVAALHSLDADRARTAARDQLQHGAVDRVLLACMDLLVDDPRPGDRPAIHALLARLHGVEPPVPSLRIRAARHLLSPYRRATVPEQLRSRVLDSLAEHQAAGEGEAALLVYLLDAERGRARMIAGLRSKIPWVRWESAVALAFVGGSDELLVGEPAELQFHRWSFVAKLEPWLRAWEA